ncbi:MAG: proton-conducting transporter membrane subunit, partial [Gammaproteobacteria bacterium]|nr:proton-conducting transporter membrane subunit [Gammaproteobacteria bacterium]
MTLDFSTPAHYLLALLPEIVLSVWGTVVLLAGVWKGGATSAPRAGSGNLAVLAMVGVLAAAFANGWLYGLTPGQGSTMIAVDRFHLFANWIFLLAAMLALAISPAYVRRQRLQEGEFHALVLFATVGMMLMGGTRDLIVIFLALEVMSISAYVLSGFNRRDPKSAESGLKYFLLGAFSTGFLLYGIALVYGATGSTNLGLIALAIGSDAAVAGLLHIGIALLAIGFAFKVSAIPFHMWTPDVYE